jgi:hypothetical protein
MTLFMQYQEELPSSLKPLFSLVDLAPLFRKMAEEVLHKEIKEVVAEIMEVITKSLQILGQVIHGLHFSGCRRLIDVDYIAVH